MSSSRKFLKQRFVDSFTGIHRNVGQRTSDPPQFVEAKHFDGLIRTGPSSNVTGRIVRGSFEL